MPDFSLPAPVCGGLGRWQQERRCQRSWPGGLEQPHEPGSKSPTHAHFSAGLTRHNSKIKSLKFQDGDGRSLKSNCGALCNHHEADPPQYLLILLTSQGSSHLSPRYPSIPVLTDPWGYRSADMHLTGKSIAIPTPSALQPASVLTSSHTPPSLLLQKRKLMPHSKTGCLLPRRGPGYVSSCHLQTFPSFKFCSAPNTLLSASPTLSFVPLNKPV